MRGTAHTLEFDPFDDRTWRLIDVSVGEREAGHVVAYVERIGDAFEVIWVWGTHGSDRFASLDAVRDAAMALLAVFDRAHRTRPVPIPHRPPVAR